MHTGAAPAAAGGARTASTAPQIAHRPITRRSMLSPPCLGRCRPRRNLAATRYWSRARVSAATRPPTAPRAPRARELLRDVDRRADGHFVVQLLNVRDVHP